MVITRDKLRKMYEENIIEVKEKHIQKYVDDAQQTIIRLNNKGDKQYTKYFFKEEPEIIEEVRRRLYEIFIDCEVVFHKADMNSEDRIFIDWS